MNRLIEAIPADVLAKIPPYEASTGEGSPVALVKIQKVVMGRYGVNRTASWAWYICGYSAERDIAFGLVDGLELELGAFSLDEIAAIDGTEVDTAFEPVAYAELREQLESERRPPVVPVCIDETSTAF